MAVGQPVSVDGWISNGLRCLAFCGAWILCASSRRVAPECAWSAQGIDRTEEANARSAKARTVERNGGSASRQGDALTPARRAQRGPNVGREFFAAGYGAVGDWGEWG